MTFFVFLSCLGPQANFLTTRDALGAMFQAAAF